MSMTLEHGGVMIPKHTHADVLKSGKEAWLRAMCGFGRSAGSIPVVGTIGMWLSWVEHRVPGRESDRFKSGHPDHRSEAPVGWGRVSVEHVRQRLGGSTPS